MIACPIGKVNWTENAQDVTDAEIVWPIENCCDEMIDDPANPGTQIDALVANPHYVQAAVEAMHERSCRRFGICDLQVRPCIPNCECRQSTCVSQCDHRRFDLADFTHHPIIEIAEVRIAGAVVPSGDYWISGRRWLIPRRGGLLWDCPKQDLNAAPGSEDSWDITMTIGERPPELLLIAAADLACQLYKFCTNQPCDLPQNAVSVIRDGTTIRLKTGLEAVTTVKMALEVWGQCSKKKRRSRMVHPADALVHTSSPG